MEGLVGVIASDTNVAGVTVSLVLVVTSFSVALIVTLPTATLVARPLLAAALLTVAILLSDELQVTAVVRGWWVLSVKVPITVNG